MMYFFPNLNQICLRCKENTKKDKIIFKIFLQIGRDEGQKKSMREFVDVDEDIKILNSISKLKPIYSGRRLYQYNEDDFRFQFDYYNLLNGI